MSHLNAIHPSLREYADMALADGMKVYAAEKPYIRPDGTPLPLKFFHFSRERDGKVYYGTVSRSYIGYVSVTMPRTPDQTFGSAVTIADTEHQKIAVTVETLRKATRQTNGHYWAVTPRDAKWAQQQANSEPWGIGTQYTEVR